MLDSIRRVLGGNTHAHVLALFLVVLMLVFHVATGGRALTYANLQTMLASNVYLLILTIGMMMVVTIGQIDLSVGSVAAFTSMTVALLMHNHGFPWWAGLLVGLLIGAAIGTAQGILIALVGIPGVIVTLAGMMIFRGADLWESRALSIPVPPEFQFLGAGYLPEWGPTWTQMNNSTLVLGIIVAAITVTASVRRYLKHVRGSGNEPETGLIVARSAAIIAVVGLVTWLFGHGATGTSFPIPGILLLVILWVFHLLTQRTAFGRHMYAVGGNQTAAALAGVDTRKVQIAVMAIMGCLAALAGMVFAGRSTAAGPQDGSLWELEAIAAVFIGGAAVSGGIGTVTGAVLGGLVMASLNNGLMLLGIGGDRAQIIKGIVLLIAVTFDIYQRRAGRPSVSGRLFPGGNTAGGVGMRASAGHS